MHVTITVLVLIFFHRISEEQMTDSINTFVEYLLDTQTTSDVLFNDTIHKEQTFYNRQYLSNYEEILYRKLQQWKDYYEREQRTITEPKMEDESSEESSESNPEDNDEEDDDNEKSSKPVEHIKTKVRNFPQEIIETNSMILDHTTHRYFSRSSRTV